MSASHFFIWVALFVTVIALITLAWCVLQFSKGRKIQQIVNEQLVTRITAQERWAGAYVDFQEATAQSYAEEIADMNKRLIELETENKITEPKRRDDEEDPFSGARSWAAQAAAAERGERLG